MKITKTSHDANIESAARTAANIGCDKCPKCGEYHPMEEYVKDSTMGKGIISLGPRIVTKGLIKLKIYNIDCYKCLTCGTEWESEPYLTQIC